MAEWTKRFALDGKWALVTGASKGIGEECCRVLADAGANIIATARDEAGLASVKAEVEALGRTCHVIAADLADRDAPVAVGKRALELVGTVDILVNNAGVALLDKLVDASVDDWDTTMAVNLRAPFLLARTLAPAMIAQRSGKIVNISSQSGVIGLDRHGAYCASKGGLDQLTRVMAIEWSPYNVQANSVCPNIVFTKLGREVWGDPEKNRPMRERTPAGRFVEPVEVADLVLFLASPASDMITGSVHLIDGGYVAA
jgi:NAD(P)-dependent dehydrogenase (short-subunit alcohol dehydrogenase family)